MMFRRRVKESTFDILWREGRIGDGGRFPFGSSLDSVDKNRGYTSDEIVGCTLIALKSV
jgi:hypothetical protein